MHKHNIYKHPEGKKIIGERLLFYSSGDTMELSNEGINLVSEISSFCKRK